MLRVLEEKRKKRLAAEYGETWRPVAGGVRVALVYPNTYALGMSNLGFQTVYHLLNRRDEIHCERVFLPDRADQEELGGREALYHSLESGSRLTSFDILAFSISFENDYIHIVEILKGAGIPPLRRDREYGRDPMVWMGGVAISINPEPVANFADLIFIGEADELLPEVMDRLAGRSLRGSTDFSRFAEAVCRLEGAYFPHAYHFDYDPAGRVTAVRVDRGYPSRVRRRWVEDLDRSPTVSRILTADTELNDMVLIELDRGCGRHCRFCAAGYVYRPPRFRSAAKVLEAVEAGLELSDRIGLVGTAVSDYPGIDGFMAEIRKLGARVSVSSLRADSLSPSLIGALAASGHKTLSLAPEGGSQRIRDVINKGMTDEIILEACGKIFESGILNIKLYFMVGLPFEETEDLEDLVALVRRVKEIQIAAGKREGRIGRITVSLNCFVPKANTPFQWAAMDKRSALSLKMGYIKKTLRKEGNIRVIQDLPKWAIIQGILSRSDRRVSSLLISVADNGGNWVQALRHDGLGHADAPFRVRDDAELFPWETIESGCRRDYLFREYKKSAAGSRTARCPGDLLCGRCGVCEGADSPDEKV